MTLAFNTQPRTKLEEAAATRQWFELIWERNGQRWANPNQRQLAEWADNRFKILQGQARRGSP